MNAKDMLGLTVAVQTNLKGWVKGFVAAYDPCLGITITDINDTSENLFCLNVHEPSHAEIFDHYFVVATKQILSGKFPLIVGDTKIDAWEKAMEQCSQASCAFGG